MIAAWNPARHRATAWLAAAAGTLAIAGVLALVTLVATAVHVRAMREASIVCETGTPVLGGWAEPDTCEGAPGYTKPSYEQERILDPWTSAVGAVVVVGGWGLLSLWSVVRLYGTSWRRALARLGGALVVVVLASAGAYQALLVPGAG